MALTKAFTDAVLSGDKLGTKIMIKDILIIDPSLRDYNEMIKFAEENMPNLYDSHDGEMLKDSSAEWTEDYLNEQMVILIGNFSKERLELLKKMVQKLYYKPEEKVVVRNQHYQEATPEWSSKKKVGTALAVVGGVTAVAGFVTTNMLAIGGGLGAAAVGVVLVVTDKE